MSIAQKLVKAREMVGAIGKDSTNPHQKWKYRGYEQIYAEVQKVFNELGIVIARIESYDEKFTQEGKFWHVYCKHSICLIDADDPPEQTVAHSDYKQIWSTMPVGNSNTGLAQACGGLQSYAMKYHLISLLQIPTSDSDMEDPDAQVGRQTESVKRQSNNTDGKEYVVEQEKMFKQSCKEIELIDSPEKLTQWADKVKKLKLSPVYKKQLGNLYKQKEQSFS